MFFDVGCKDFSFWFDPTRILPYQTALPRK
jgi:hypothetical protein